jgi:hypothetical protein
MKQYQLEKLVAFSKYETTIANSSIQDVTHILKTIIYDYEEYTPESKIDMLADRVQNYLGLDLMSLFVGILSVS